MAQLPPDSQRATRSHWLSVAALAWPVRRPLPPRTAPVTAILATVAVDVDVLGLRCRPAMSTCGPVFWWCRAGSRHGAGQLRDDISLAEAALASIGTRDGQ